MNIPCFLIPALVGLICGILGYLLGKMLSKSSSNDGNNYKSDLEICQRRTKQLELDLESLRTQNNTSSQKANFASNADASQMIAFDSDAFKAVFGKKIKENDLKIVEGIGPKIEELFKTSGILTWKSLSETSVDRLKEILLKAGERFQMHDPGTWARQAKLAYEGKWQELKNWQDQLDGGRE